MAQDVVVETNCGKIRGIAENDVKVFKGIPYAESPAGEGRFAPPIKLQPWTGVRDAFEFGDRAMQDDNAFALPPAMLKLFAGRELPPMSENCLVLNVWTPAINDGRKRPVMFWCHGGAFIAGSGDSPWYEGTNLCRRGDVVVVTINHRLGAFGYVHLAELGGEEFAASGNAGMLDIVAALKWVRDNIAAFGGDAGNVTIFGESGGGAKVSVLMAMPAAHGLFHKAIIQSGPAVEMASRDDAAETARQLLAELNLSSDRVSELRRIPALELARAQAAVLKKVSMMSFANRRRVGFNPVVDGKHLPGGPFAPTAPAISANSWRRGSMDWTRPRCANASRCSSASRPTESLNTTGTRGRAIRGATSFSRSQPITRCESRRSSPPTARLRNTVRRCSFTCSPGRRRCWTASSNRRTRSRSRLSSIRYKPRG